MSKPPERPKEFEFSSRTIVLIVLVIIAAAALTIEATYLVLGWIADDVAIALWTRQKKNRPFGAVKVCRLLARLTWPNQTAMVAMVFFIAPHLGLVPR
jgi:hypothetical protein